MFQSRVVPREGRTYPIGAEILADGSTHFRVWAPASRQVALELVDKTGKLLATHALRSEPEGYYSVAIREAGPGTRYRYKVDTGSFPDPMSRFQPEGPHGPSQVVDSTAFAWTDEKFRGHPKRDLVIYEMHIGTFTSEGTWRAAADQLAELRRVGITMIEVMPIAEFPGAFGWGYDGVDLFAPSHLYGHPDDVRAFVNRAHEVGLMVILDVVYNHFGPDGNYFRQFSQDYFSTKYHCEWGDAINFDNGQCGPVREFFLTNVRYWIEEFHFDGLRLDATQQVYDASTPHIVTEIARVARASAPQRNVYVVAENELQEAKMVRSPEEGGYGIDAMWNDDFHHTAMVAATGHIEAYYTDYRGAPQEFISSLKYGYLYQGQWYNWQSRRRGHTALDLHPDHFVTFLQNHDQIANSLHGLRIHQLASPGRFKALTALMLLSPGTPLFFQGQEFAASSPFLYFADHNEELCKLVRKGRHEFLTQFRSIATKESRELLAEPAQREVFNLCKLDFSERKKNAAIYEMHRDLLRLRREDSTIAQHRRIDGAVLGTEAFAIRFFSADKNDRLLLVNLGADHFMNPCPEPLLAPVDEKGWTVEWSSEDPRYGGRGTPPIETTSGWVLPASCAVLLKPDERHELPRLRLSEKN